MIRFKQLRTEANLTQQEIASFLGITRAAYSNIETRKREPDFSVIFRLADYYDVTLDYLLGRSDLKKENPAPISGSGTDDILLQRLLDIYGQLSRPRQQDLVRYGDMLVTEQDKEGNDVPPGYQRIAARGNSNIQVPIIDDVELPPDDSSRSGL